MLAVRGGMSTATKRDWAGRTVSDTPIAYVNNTAADVRIFHKAVMEAIANGGTLPEEIADIFTLTRPKGVWILDFA